MGTFTLFLIIAHLISDYPLQTDKIFTAKKSVCGLIKHILVHLGIGILTSIIFNIIYPNNYDITLFIYCLLIINGGHFLIDYIKEYLSFRIKKTQKLHTASSISAVIYVLDQLIHFIIIIETTQWIFKENYQVLDKILALVDINDKFSLSITTQILLTIIIILMNTYFAGYLIGIILTPFKPDNLVTETAMEVPFKSQMNGPINYKNFEELNISSLFNNEKTNLSDIKIQHKIVLIKDSPSKSGMLIGKLERNIILILCVTSSLAAIGFLIAMKALTRFKQFEDKSFAEYYLIGSMASILLAMLFGFILLAIW